MSLVELKRILTLILQGYEVHEFGGIEANPDFDTLIKAVAEIKKLDMDRVYLLAVGGGSVADGTKFIAAACKYTDSEDLWNLVLTGAHTITAALPIGVVLTLPAVCCSLWYLYIDWVGK